MLSKIAKLIGVGAIIGLNGLSTWANRIEIKRESLCTIVIEGIDLPRELSDNKHPLWDDYGDKIDYIGLKLELPEELIKACKDKYWTIYNKEEQKILKKIVLTEENFHIWCNAQKKQSISKDLYPIYAYILRKVNKKHYFVPGSFCKYINLYNVLINIYYKEATFCMFILPETQMGKYLKDLKLQIEWLSDTPEVELFL